MSIGPLNGGDKGDDRNKKGGGAIELYKDQRRQCRAKEIAESGVDVVICGGTI